MIYNWCRFIPPLYHIIRYICCKQVPTQCLWIRILCAFKQTKAWPEKLDKTNDWWAEQVYFCVCILCLHWLDYQYRPASVVLFDHAIPSPIHHPCMAFVHPLNTTCSMMHDHQRVNGVLLGVMHQQFELDCFYSFCSVVHNICSWFKFACQSN